MSRPSRTIITLLAGIVGVALVVSVAVAARPDRRELNGTVWVANRGAHSIRGFDAATGSVNAAVAMRANSQPGDLAYAKGKLYVAEEFGSPPAIAIVDAESGVVLDRIFTGPRPHHVHTSVGGNLIAYGVFGTNRVGIIDTHTDTLVGECWRVPIRPRDRTLGSSPTMAARSTSRTTS
jgi:DNA-binding beta-propeller fold protein YncE